jgi:PAS domain S-box-containing protein
MMLSASYPPYVLLLLIAAAASAALAHSAWQRRPAPGAAAFALLMLAVTQWALAYAQSVASVDLPSMYFWDKAIYLGTVAIGPAWLVFVLQYTGREKWLTRRNVARLAALPVVTLALAWTNEAHGLIYSRVGLRAIGSFPIFDVTYGMWFWIHIAYSYALVGAGTVLLFQVLLRSPHLYRGQVLAVLVGILAPWVANMLDLAGLQPLQPLDPTPFAFTVTGLAVVLGLLRFRLFDVVPVARDAIVETMRDGVIVLDCQGRIADVNPAAQRMMGCTSEAIGQPAERVLSRWPVLLEHGWNGIETKVETVLGEDVQGRTCDLHIMPLYRRRGDLAGQLLILRDITERVRGNAEREALIAQLKAKNAELERFTYTVSHDLKSPLITIQGFLGFLEQAALAGDVEQVKADIGRISNAASKMQKLLEDLLELSRIGRVVNAPQAVPLGELAHETVGLLTGQLMERGVEVIIAADLPVVYGDRPRLLEVLQNLVENAVKYMGEQPRPRVEIGLRYHDDEPVFFVRDNGIGIEPRYHERVFDLFARLDQKSTGAGVGLAIVKRIVEVHGGRIWVESEGGGRGSTFCFVLPEYKA